MFLFFFITILLIAGIVFILASVDTKEISENWPKYRCSPSVMPFAGLYGHDTNENITQIMFRAQIAGTRMRFLMNRLFATFYAMIYMGVSGITAVTSFGDTFLFRFLDTFCFPPETLVEIEGFDTPVPISTVKIGDRFKGTDDLVTAVFSFYSDGQPMVEFPNGLQVSTNHYMYYNNLWIQAQDHPEAKRIQPWSGGVSRPLICLNTNHHRLFIGGYEFLDYDETELGDKETMSWVEHHVNGEFKNLSKTIPQVMNLAQEKW